MLPARRFALTAALAMVFWTPCYSQDSSSDDVTWRPPGAHLSRGEALKIARAAALKRGFNLGKFESPTAEYESRPNRHVWTVTYRGNAPVPGNFFEVVVDDQTGKADVMPGF